MKTASRAEFALILPYGDQRIRCNVRRSRTRARSSVAIHVEADGRVLVDAPLQAAESDVRSAVARRVAWIHRRLLEVENRLRLVIPREYVSGETVYYLGRRYRLKVISTDSGMGTRMWGGYVEVRIGSRVPDLIRKELQDWYRARAKIVLMDRFKEISSRLRWVKEAPPVSLRTMRVQWGSCSPNGRITLNPALVRAPRECIDYVLLHELCHLKEHNHGAKFYRLLDMRLPGWRKVKERLDNMADAILTDR